jgi:5-methylcytosine-specific restriction endonuclease McrA
MPPRRPPTEAWPNGSTRAWRKIRERILKRDSYRCQLKLPGCTFKATAVHHIYGRQITGDNPQYLQAACQSCNSAIGDPQQPRKGSGQHQHKTDPDPRRSTIW